MSHTLLENNYILTPPSETLKKKQIKISAHAETFPS